MQGTERTAAEAIEVLQRAIAATDESLAAMTSIEQLQYRLEETVINLVEEPEIWNAAQSAYAQAREALNHARGCLEELQVQIAAAQSPEVQSRAWAEQLVALNEKLQSQLTVASQQASRFYELIRPALIAVHLQYATRVPRWAETWPLDAERAKNAWKRLGADADVFQVGEFDLQLAEFRWDVGWPQQRIASVVGLSQPAVAARLGRLELLLSVEIAAEQIREQAAEEGFHTIRWYPIISRLPQEPVGELVLESDECTIQLDILVASGETGTAKRGIGPWRSSPLDLLRLEATARRQWRAQRTVTGMAVYFRDRGVVGYFPTQEVATALRRLGRLPTETLLQQLRETLGPARTLRELIERSERPALDSTSSRGGTRPAGDDRGEE